MPAEHPTINLLGQDTSANSPWNRIMDWISTYGRYIMITTELIVLIAFASRFTLDRKLTDLKEDIAEKQEILEVNADLEKNIRTVQKKIDTVKILIQQQPVPINTLILIQTLLPLGTQLESLTIDKEKVTAAVIADTAGSFTQLLANLSVSKKLTNIEVGKVGKNQYGIHFIVTAKIQANAFK